MNIDWQFNDSWRTALALEFEKPYFTKLQKFVETQYQVHACAPLPSHVFRIFDLVRLEDVAVVILWQDPYHTPDVAMGMAFSVPSGSRSQPSLRNMFKELTEDLDILRTDTDLTDWSNQGVFLLNSVLTVQHGLPGSHRGQGWENFTDAVISAISRECEGVVFILWWNSAISKIHLIDVSKHQIITSPHPSPFSAYSGFFGSRPFSRANEYLKTRGKPPIIWGNSV